MTDDQKEVEFQRMMRECEMHFQHHAEQIRGMSYAQAERKAADSIAKLDENPELGNRMKAAIEKVSEGMAEMLLISIKTRGEERPDNPFISLRHAIDLARTLPDGMRPIFLQRALQKVADSLFEPWGAPVVMKPGDVDTMKVLRFGRDITGNPYSN